MPDINIGWRHTTEEDNRNTKNSGDALHILLDHSIIYIFYLFYLFATIQYTAFHKSLIMLYMTLYIYGHMFIHTYHIEYVRFSIIISYTILIKLDQITIWQVAHKKQCNEIK